MVALACIAYSKQEQLTLVRAYNNDPPKFCQALGDRCYWITPYFPIGFNLLEFRLDRLHDK